MDEARFPTRRSLFSFHNTPAKVVQLCCCLERHAVTLVDTHYHMALKLDRNQRWLQSKKDLLHKLGISVHFSTIHTNYYSAWQYVTKKDSRFIQSLDHPDVVNCHPPRTTLASVANHSRPTKKQSPPTDELVEERSYEHDDAELESVDNNYNLPNSAKRKKKTNVLL